MDITKLVICLTFISQIIVLSVYVPFVGRRYSRELVRRYPEHEYPLLYPLGADVRIARGEKLKLAYYAMGLLSALALIVGLLIPFNAFQFGILMMVCFTFQDAPNLVAGLWMRQRDQALKKMSPPSIRSSQLIPRTWEEFISLRYFYIVMGLYLTTIFVMLACITMDWETSKAMRSMVLASAVIVILCTLQIAYIIWYINKAVESPRDDPYASMEDVIYRAKNNIKMLVRGYVAFNVIWLIGLGIGMTRNLSLLNVNLEVGFVCCSLMAQILYVGFVHNMADQLNTTDYSVYRKAML